MRKGKMTINVWIAIVVAILEVLNGAGVIDVPSEVIAWVASMLIGGNAAMYSAKAIGAAKVVSSTSNDIAPLSVSEERLAVYERAIGD